MRYVIGIDPGQNGGIAVLDVVDHKLRAIRMPVFRPSKKTKVKKTTYDISTLVAIFDIPAKDVICAVLERVNTMHGQGIVSGGKLMYGLGLMHGLIAKFPHELVMARVWKGKLGLSSDKELSRAMASQLFPLCADRQLWHTKNRDGVAEAALLIAFYLNKIGLDVDLTKVLPQT